MSNSDWRVSSSCGSKLCNCWECWCSYPELHHCLVSSLCSDARWLQSEPSPMIHTLCFLLNDVKNSGPMFDCILSFLTLQLYMTSEAILRYLKLFHVSWKFISYVIRCQKGKAAIKCFFRYLSKKVYSNSSVQCPVFVCIGNFCLFVALAISCSMKNKRIIEQKFYFHNKTHCYALHCICLSNTR